MQYTSIKTKFFIKMVVHGLEVSLWFFAVFLLFAKFIEYTFDFFVQRRFSEIS